MSFNLSMDMSIVLIWQYFRLGALLSYVAHMCVASVLLLWLLPKVPKHFGDAVNLWSNGAQGKTTAFKCGVFSKVKANVK